MTPAEWNAFIERALARPKQEPTDEPDPHRCDHLTPGTPEWARVGNAGHRCQRCAALATRYDRERGVDATWTAHELAGETQRLLATISELQQRVQQLEDARAEVAA